MKQLAELSGVLDHASTATRGAVDATVLDCRPGALAR